MLIQQEENVVISFYIIRHGETLLNSLNRAQGWSDSPLTGNGEKTAKELGIKLKNITFIQMVSDWLGGVTSFAELNRRLPDVAMAIYEHDTTGMAEPFTDIANRLNSVLVDIAHNKSLKQNSNILVVTHAFAIKTFLYLFAPEKLCTMDKLKNATILKLLYDGKSFLFEKTDFE